MRLLYQKNKEEQYNHFSRCRKHTRQTQHPFRVKTNQLPPSQPGIRPRFLRPTKGSLGRAAANVFRCECLVFSLEDSEEARVCILTVQNCAASSNQCIKQKEKKNKNHTDWKGRNTQSPQADKMIGTQTVSESPPAATVPLSF